MLSSKKKSITHTPIFRRNSVNLRLPELAYYLFFVLMLGAKGLGLGEGSPLYSVVLLISMFFWCVKIILTGYTIYELLCSTSLLLITMFVYLRTGERGIVFYVAMLLGMKEISLDKIFHIGARLLSFCFILMAFLHQTGLLDDLYYVHLKGSLGYVVRSSFGYAHPNVLHITYLVLTTLVLYDTGLDLHKLLRRSILLMVGNVYLAIYSLSYTGFLIVSFYIITNYILIFKNEHPSQHTKCYCLCSFLMECIFPFSVIFSVLGPVVLKGRLYSLADKLVHHRFVLSNYFLTTEPVCLFGHRLLTTPDMNHSIDCSYTYLFVHLGVILFVLFCIFYFIVIHKCIQAKKFRCVAILISFSIAGVTEPFLFNTSFKNITFLILGYYWYQFLAVPKTKIAQKATPLPLNWNPSLGKKQLQLLYFSIPSSKLTFLRQRVAKRKSLFVVSLFAALLAPIFYVATTEPYTAVLIPIVFCQDGCDTPARTYTESEISELSSDTLVISFDEKSEEIYQYTGFTPRLEYFRRTLAYYVWAFFFIYCFMRLFDVY